MIQMIQTANFLGFLSAVLPLVVGCHPVELEGRATDAQLRSFASGLDRADRAELDLFNAHSARSIMGKELEAIVEGLSPGNLEGWGNFSKFKINGTITFFDGDERLGTSTYSGESIFCRDDVYVKLKHDIFKAVIATTVPGTVP